MDRSELKEYLGMLVDMESAVYTMTEIGSQLSHRISQLGIQNHPPVPQKKTHEDANTLGVVLLILLGGSLTWLCFCFLLWAFGVDKIDSVFNVGLVLIVCLAIVGGIVTSRENERDAQRIQEENLTAQKAYESACKADNQRVEKELVQKSLLSEQLREIEKKCAETRDRLTQMYSLGIIYPKYHNWIMICSLYEYISSGRCDTLEGHGGAYDTIETELRANMIITQLNEVIQLLHKVHQTQFVVQDMLQQSQKQQQKILDAANEVVQKLDQTTSNHETLLEELKTLNKSSETATYIMERSQKELAYLNRMNYLSGKNDGTYFNVPPAE